MTDLVASGTRRARRGSAIAIALLVLAACSRQAEQNQPVANASETIAPATNEPAPEIRLNPPAPGEPGGLPDDRTPVSEGPIDPKSAQGAGQVLQTYFALVEEGNFTEAGKLWPEGTEKLGLAKYKEVHANIGGPGEMEGAAGSSYIEYPVQLYGRTRDSKEFNSRGTMTLRRVNDVPGSTEEQRKWRIFKSDFPGQ